MSALLNRLPIESARPLVVFAAARVVVAGAALVVVLALGLPFGGRLAAVLAGAALPWGVVTLFLAHRRPDLAMNPLLVAGDLAVLVTVEAIVPESYGAVRFLALFFLAVHAHFQGERIGLAVGALAVLALAIPTAISEGGSVRGELLVFYEVVFAAAALGTVALVGRFRTAESASRLRARELSRRALEAEHDVRRRVSESLHDGPVQELIGLDMALAAARREAEGEGAEATARILEEAHEVVTRNVRWLRDEMLDLGPYAYEEMSLEMAVERCVPVWERRYGLEAHLAMERIDLPSEIEGDLFRITQEAVVNAARHGGANNVTISLERSGRHITLVVRDDGKGFGSVDPLGPSEPGHIGLASIRERTEILSGALSIESTEAGSTVTVRVPLEQSLPRS